MRLSSTGCAAIALSTVSLIGLGPQAADDARTIAGLTFDEALESFASLLLDALSAWILVCTALAFLAAKSAVLARVARAITPKIVYRTMFIGVAGALVVGPASAASNTDRGSDANRPSVTSKTLDGLRLPDRPIGTTRTAQTSQAIATQTVTVRPGDSLWSIACLHPGDDSTDSEIQSAVEVIYDANRNLIGSDPNLILPGQQLTTPSKESR